MSVELKFFDGKDRNQRKKQLHIFIICIEETTFCWLSSAFLSTTVLYPCPPCSMSPGDRLNC